jgi:predicted ArsR family transcriptional regulator
VNDSIEQRRARRASFLRRLYERVNGSVSEFITAADIAAELRIEDAEARRIFEYFEEKGFVKVDDHREGILRITAAGIDEVEDRLLE